MVFSGVKKDLLLAFSFSKSEFQLPMKSEEAGHECIIWVQKFHLPEPKIHQPRASG